MMELEVLHGYCTIQLYRKVGGSNAQPHTIKWEVCGNTLVDECNFYWLNQNRWLMVWSLSSKAYYARRTETLSNGERVHVEMAREILGLHRGPGHNGDKADHKNHRTLENTLDNLRITTPSQSKANQRKCVVKSRFKGVQLNGLGFSAYTKYDGQTINFPTMYLENEAGFMYNHSAKTLFGEFAHLNVISEDEIPSLERQEWLKKLVDEKLRQKRLI